MRHNRYQVPPQGEPESSARAGGLLGWVHVDLHPDHRLPSALRLLIATALAVAVSLLADFLLTRIGVAVFPSTSGYPHFGFGDYAPLTVLGVLVACAGWPVVARCTAQPVWLFLRLAVLVTAVLLLPDLGIYLQGQPGRAVLVLVLMHLAIGVITYNALLRLAPVRPRDQTGQVHLRQDGNRTLR